MTTITQEAWLRMTGKGHQFADGPALLRALAAAIRAESIATNERNRKLAATGNAARAPVQWCLTPDK